MNLAYTVAEQEFQAWAREFLAAEIPGEIRERYSRGGEVVPSDFGTVQRILNSHGLATPSWPIEWGGKDWTPVQRHIWADTMQRMSIPEPLGFNVSMVGPVIAEFGNEEQKKRFLPATANLDIWWCQGFSEPEAGSDLASLRTTAVRDGDSYLVNGQKIWTTLAHHADWIFCLVRTDPKAVKKQAGISFLVMPMDTPGITVRRIDFVDGGHECNEVFFDNVRVPAENLIGAENNGWTMAKFLLGNERTGVTRAGHTAAQLARAKQHAAGTPGGNGRPLLEDPLFAARIAETENELLALELTLLRVVAGSADGKPNPASSLLKLRGSELMQATTEIEMDIAALDSLVYGTPDPVDDGIASPAWARASAPSFLNNRKVSIYSGSSEVQRTIIASSILGL
jgi:alkylation response protein AidB-like acyl-CoA dehydrogenase